MLFSIIAPFYDRFMKMAKLDYSSEIARWLSPVEGRELLDLAGGTGINAVALARAGARVTVLDRSRAMLVRAGEKEADIRIMRADAADIHLPDKSFDIVLVSDAWHHFRQQDRVAGEVARLLRPGGRIYIVDFDREKIKTKFLGILERILGEPSTFMTPEELGAAFKTKGIAGRSRYISSNQFIYEGYKEE